jgi:hypothetical protein
LKLLPWKGNFSKDGDNAMKPIVIAEFVRSPFTIAYKGKLARVRPDEMASQVIKGLLQRAKIDAEEVEDLIVGCAFPEGEQGFNMARLIGFLADLCPLQKTFDDLRCHFIGANPCEFTFIGDGKGGAYKFCYDNRFHGVISIFGEVAFPRQQLQFLRQTSVLQGA